MPNFTCPSGGTWHACATGSRFVGCCTQIDACTLGCSAGNLMPASFDIALSGRIPDLDCGTSGSLFYTCALTDPSFWGCCKSNPCTSDDGCARTDLGAAYLGANAVAGSYYGVTGTASASASATGSAAATPSSSLLPSSSSSSSSTSFSSSPSPTPRSNTTTIIAAAVGGVAGGILITAALAFLIWKRARRHHHSNGPGVPDSEHNAAATAFMETKRGAPATTAAPEKQLAGTAGILLDGPDAVSSPLLLPPTHHRNGVGVFELESGVDVPEQRRGEPAELVELMAEPVERVELAAGGGGVVTQSVGAGRRGSAAGSSRLSVDGSVASSVKHAQCTEGDDGDDGFLDVPQVSPQSASFDLGRNNRDSGVSSLTSVPRTPVVGQRGEVLLEDED